MAKGKTKGRRLNKRIVSDALINLFQSQPNVTFSFKQIFKLLRLDTHPAKMLAINAIEEMAWDDFLVKVSDSSYRLNVEGQVQEGIFHRKSNGKNLFIADGSDEPILVVERNSLFAFDGDRVKVTLMARRHNQAKEAMVTEIIQRKTDQFVGRLQVERDYAFLITESNIFVHDIMIPKRSLKGGKTGDKAVVRITQWPSREKKNIVGEVVDVLGKQGENTAEMHAILAKYGLPYKYPKHLEELARKISGKITEQDVAERVDFREVTTFTIDPYDAKDYDDALSIRPFDENTSVARWFDSDKDEKSEGNKIVKAKTKERLWEVGVHIADVSHYVHENSPIDKEAQRRATSVYLVDRTIPMLPEHLCNFVCSLRPNEDKLCYSTVFLLNDKAEIIDWRLCHTIIRSNRRFAYEEAQAILEQNGVVDGTGEPAPIPNNNKYVGEYGEELCLLDMLAKRLRTQRFNDGAVKFDREELHFDVDKDGKPTRCYYKKSKDANKLIEEFMLLANRKVAESIGRVKKGTRAKTLPYRIHDQPDPTKLEDLRQFVKRFGYKVKTTGTRSAISRSLNTLMDDCQGRGEQKLVEIIALKAMMKAKYSVHNIGHYGLAFDYYTHFTSPIRRYPDTMVHRLLTRYQAGGRSANKDYYEQQCQHSSDMEQVAQNAERESIKYKMVEFMSTFIGEEFEAHISGIQSYGFFCEIDSNHCEGLVSMHSLDDDYYELDEKNFSLVGRRHHRRYRLGDAVKIRVAKANIDKRQLDFELV